MLDRARASGDRHRAACFLRKRRRPSFRGTWRQSFMATKIRPLNDKLVIKRLEAEEKTKGGIVLPDTAKEKPREGRVVAVGEGKLLDSGKRSKLQVKENDRVIFSSYAGTEIKINGEEFLILEEGDVLAVVD